MSGADGDGGELREDDVQRLLEAVQSRNKGRIAGCVLSIKALLAEVQQQLLLLMDDSGDRLSECELLSPKSEPLDPDETTQSTEVDQPLVVPPVDAALDDSSLQHSTISLDSADNSTASAGTSGRENASDDGQRSRRKSAPRKLRPCETVKVPCEVCGVELQRHHLTRHMLKHSGLRPYECSQCEAKFSRKDKLTDHVKRHEQHQQAGTRLRRSATATARSRAAASARRLAAPREFQCNVCDFKCTGRSLYRAHRKEKHPHVQNIYRCDMCDKEFTCPSHLEQHNIKHSTEKKFVCELCGVRFSREPNLSRHIRSHTAPAPFSCSYCKKPYYRQNELVVHIRKHTGEKPFVCDICGAGYASTKYLKRHMFTHTGLKPHACDVCDKKFARVENMRAHRKLHDKDKGQGQGQMRVVGSAVTDAVATAFRASQSADAGRRDEAVRPFATGDNGACFLPE